jgi:two-component system, OmpR family, phosphate regulon response regulator PhoB
MHWGGNHSERKGDGSASVGLGNGRATPLPTARILVVEDHPDTLDAVGEYLRQRGFDVEVASDGQAAMRIIREKRPDIVYLDMNLPHISGYDVCEQIRADADIRGTGILMTSAQSSFHVKAFCLEAGADAFLAKPFEIEKVAEVIGWIVESKRNGCSVDTARMRIR